MHAPSIIFIHQNYPHAYIYELALSVFDFINFMFMDFLISDLPGPIYRLATGESRSHRENRHVAETAYEIDESRVLSRKKRQNGEEKSVTMPPVIEVNVFL